MKLSEVSSYWVIIRNINIFEIENKFKLIFTQ